jgi:hypothetical protein
MKKLTIEQARKNVETLGSLGETYALKSRGFVEGFEFRQPEVDKLNEQLDKTLNLLKECLAMWEKALKGVPL